MNQNQQRRIIQQLIGQDNDQQSNIHQQISQNCPQILQKPQLNSYSIKTTISPIIQPQIPIERLPLQQIANDTQKIIKSANHFNETLSSLFKTGQLGNFNSKTLSNNPSINFKQSEAVTFDFQICIDIGDGRLGTIFVNEETDPYKQAKQFCSEYQLQDYIVGILAQSILEQKLNQRYVVFKEKEQQHTKHKSPCRSVSIVNNVEKINQSSTYSKPTQKDIKTCRVGQNKICVGADKILKKNKSRIQSRKMSVQNLSNNQFTQPTYKPCINPISLQIVNKIGKDTIVTKNLNKSKQKINILKHQKQQNINKEMQQCVFKPKINKISYRIDKYLQDVSEIELHKNKENNSQNGKQLIPRYQHLYLDWKTQAMKKQQSRKTSLQKISFKPQINSISKKIVQKMHKNIDNNFEQQIQYWPNNSYLYKNKDKQNLSDKNLQKSIQKDKKRKIKETSLKLKGRNCSNLPVGQYLYSQAVKLQKKRQKSVSNISNNCQNLILSRSDDIVNNARQQKIRQIFHSLAKGNQYIKYQLIDFDQLNKTELLFKPIFQQMKQIGVQLCEQQFVSAVKRMLKYLSQHQKAMLLNYNKTYFVQSFKNSGRFLNRKSEQIIKGKENYKDYDVYMRGIIHQKQVKQNIERGRQTKVRQQLHGCTFKPSLNKNNQ